MTDDQMRSISDGRTVTHQNAATGKITDRDIERSVSGTGMSEITLRTTTGAGAKDGTRIGRGTTTTNEIQITEGEISDKRSVSQTRNTVRGRTRIRLPHSQSSEGLRRPTRWLPTSHLLMQKRENQVESGNDTATTVHKRATIAANAR